MAHQCGETYEIDELSQRLLVYLMTNGSTRIDDLQNPLGASSEHEIEARIERRLGPEAASLVHEIETDMTLYSDVVTEFQLTDNGKDFVYRHKDSLTLPVDLADLAQRVSRFELEFVETRFDELQHQLEEMASKVEELEEKVED